MSFFPVRILITQDGPLKGQIGDYMFSYNDDGDGVITRVEVPERHMVDLKEGEFEVISEDEYQAAKVVDG